MANNQAGLRALACRVEWIPQIRIRISSIGVMYDYINGIMIIEVSPLILFLKFIFLFPYLFIY